MRVECGSCKRIVDGSFALAAGGDGLTITCTACGATTREAFATAAEAAPSVPLEALCPKCGTVRDFDADACRACGLASARMGEFADTRDAAVPESVRAGWLELQAAWTDPAQHDAFFLRIAQHACYAWAAGRYRDASRARPGDVIARRQLERLRRAGEATMFATAAARADTTPTPYRAVLAILALLLVLIIAGVVYAVVRTDTAPPDPSAVRVR